MLRRREPSALAAAGLHTLYIEFRSTGIVETRDLDENTQLDLDADGQICALTMEHASQRAGIPDFSCEQIAA
jgi:uncharacterized protein YuzE